MPLGTFVHARSGDKGGDANLGLWVAHDGYAEVRRPGHLAVQADQPAQGPRAVPEARDLDVEVYLLPNLGGVNV